jgi:hypothetical protein
MAHTLTCGATTRASGIRAALATVTVDEVALVFPAAVPCALADPGELGELQALCQSLGKRVVIIGGDEQLRAHAVAAGFTAATRLAEWEPPTHAPQVARRTRPLWGAVRRERANVARRAGELIVMPVRSKPDGDIPTLEDGDLYDPVGDDLPGYLADLVAADESFSSIHRQAAIPTIPLRASRTTRRLDEARREAAEAEALDRAHQEYEERITETIRDTGSAAGQDAAPTGDGDGPADAATGP